MLPARLSPLRDLAYNLWWSWDTEATALWREIDAWRWDRCHHNPIALLQEVEASRWSALADDPTFCNRVESIHARFRAYLDDPGWTAREASELTGNQVAYFSMEYGLHESLRLYSGGLGVLAGDHLRSASDLGVPLVAVGLLYRHGYFRQFIDDGTQVDAYPSADFGRLPLTLCTDERGTPITIEVQLGRGSVTALVHRLDVGRNRLYLLDCDHDGNDAEGRALTYHLYGGDQYTRIRQEALLGLGGMRALRALDERTDVFHLNEGHCAFVLFELMSEALQTGLTWAEALAEVRKRVVFTTHTPVAAGHDRFSWELVDDALGPWREDLGLSQGAFMDLGRVRPGDYNETLCMTVVALRGASAANGVSKLHGAVSRHMWHDMWPQRPVDEVPIGHITNGVHPVFWMSGHARDLYDKYAPEWRNHLFDTEFWTEAVGAIPDEALWNLRFKLRKRLVDHVRRTTGAKLDPHALTIGFARRFAPYKRGNLLFHDPERARFLLDNGQRPIQIVFAGKAHPRDTMGKDLVRKVVQWSNHRGFRNRVAFIEDYDITTGGLLTSGADLWLNNPRRPMEASGTSGQKVPLNGGINLSVLDGWWPEAWDGDNGWQIGDGKQWPGHRAQEQDDHDAASLYSRIEDDILPLWSDRDGADIPRRWLKVVRHSIATCVPMFNSHRMVRDYVLDLYVPLLGSS